MEGKMPMVSVLMPAYNAEKYIAESIESILEQTHSDFEFIIIDDCSSDRTWSIIQEYASKDERILPVRNEENLGIAGNRNKAVGLANGRYIVWQDADDISLPERLNRQCSFMEENPEVGICGGWLEFFDDSGRTSIRKYKASDTDIRKTIFRFSPVAQPGAIIRKKVIEDVGQYDLNYPPAEDLDMSFRIGRAHKFANLQEVVIRYRENTAGATFSKLRFIELKTISIRLRYMDTKTYPMNMSDYLYNVAQYITIFVMPVRVRYFLFSLLRNSNK